MNSAKKSIGVFVLAKNEDRNIGRCLESLRDSAWDVVVLDSGSTDGTEQIVRGFAYAVFRDYNYTNHCNAYNEITSDLGKDYRYVAILDADMIVTRQLQKELIELVSREDAAIDAIESGILMFVEGLPLRFGSLCPPKAFVLKTGRKFFISSGHGEKLESGIVAVRTKEKLWHDDRKSYASYLQSQYRYAENLVSRKAAGQLSLKDRFRINTPALILAVPFVAYIMKMGILSGKTGALYALDRLIAEAIMFRQSLSCRVSDA